MPSVGYGSNKKTRHMLPNGASRAQAAPGPCIASLLALVCMRRHHTRFAPRLRATPRRVRPLADVIVVPGSISKQASSSSSFTTLRTLTC